MTTAAGHVPVRRHRAGIRRGQGISGYLFTAPGAVNQLLGAIGLQGPNWPADADGVIHNLLALVGIHTGPAFLVNGGFLGVSWWDWLSGPSVGMMIIITMVVFTTSGTFMLLFIAALQNLSQEV